MNFELSEAQSKVFLSKARFRLLVAGRRFGKTFLALVEAINHAVNYPNSRVWIIAPTYRQVKQVAWNELKNMVPPEARKSIHEQTLEFKLVHNNSEIALRGADNYDSLRGLGLDFVILDEFSDIDIAAWNNVIRPSLSDRGGRALFIGTPKGHNHFYKLYIDNLDNPNWETFQFTTIDGGQVSLEEIEEAKRNLPPEIFRQEFLATFETPAGRVYNCFDYKVHVNNTVKDLGGDVLIGLDFNVNPMSAVIGCRCVDELHIFDEIMLKNSNTELMCKEILKRYPRRHITIYPDPSGSARKTSAKVGVTDHSIIQSFGMKISAPRKAPPIVDRINTVNALLSRQKFFIHPKCKNTIQSLDLLVYKENGIIDKGIGLDHASDAIGYLIFREWPIVSKTPVVEEFFL